MNKVSEIIILASGSHEPEVGDCGMTPHRLMNYMNKYEHESRKGMGVGKNIVHSFFWEGYMGVLGFINVHLVHKYHYAKRISMVWWHSIAYFMNIMNSYEVGLCMAFSKISVEIWKGL